jgi:type IV pilus assembly protein PilM
MKRLCKSRTAIGIDVGSRSVKVVQLAVSGRRTSKSSIASHQIVALTMLPRVRVDQQIDRQELLDVKSVVRRQGFYGNDIVLTAPERRLLHGVFEVPHSAVGESGDPIAQIARMELSRMHNVAPDSFELVCWEQPLAGESKSTHRIRQAVAVGCPHDAANELIDLFEGAGFNVCGLDLHSAAAARACLSLAVPPPGLTAILDLGWKTTKLLLVCGDTIIYERFINSNCLVKLNARLSEMFGLTEQAADQTISTVSLVEGSEAGEFDRQTIEAVRRIIIKHFDVILEELRIPFDYASHQYPGEGIKRLLLIGGGARILGLSQYIQNVLGVEVMSAAPKDLLCQNGSQALTKLSHPAMTVAVGLAMFDGD